MAEFTRWHDTITPTRDLPGEGNPLMVCDGLPERDRRCGRIQSADLFVFYRGRYVCDACGGLLRRVGPLTDADVDPAAFATRDLPRKVSDLSPRELVRIYGGSVTRRRRGRS